MIVWCKFVRGRGIGRRVVGDKQTGTIRPDFDTSISIDFQGAKISSDTGFLLMREIDRRFDILDCAASQIDDPGSARIRIIPRSNCCGRESIGARQAMKIAKTCIEV